MVGSKDQQPAGADPGGRAGKAACVSSAATSTSPDFASGDDQGATLDEGRLPRRL